MNPCTDTELLAAVARSDEAALRALHARHARATFAFVWRMLDNTADAEDAVTEAFHDVWLNASRFRGQSSVKTWILGIARHKALDILRARGDVAHEPIDEAVAEIAEDAGTPFDQLAELQRAEMVQRCMQALPPAQKESLHLALYEGLTLAEIAAVQGVPDNTVATRIHHAKRKLRECVARALGPGRAHLPDTD